MKQVLATPKKIVSSIFRYFLKVIFKLIFAIDHSAGLVSAGTWKKLFEIIEDNEKLFVTYHFRPMRAAAINSRVDKIKDEKKLAIVIQGPVLKTNDFTLETVKLYRKHFAEAIIILSTWKEENQETIKEFDDLGIEVLLNEKPSYFGVSNINLQIVSSGNGVKHACELGAEYAMKTRTDQRFYAPNIDEFLYNITETFPVNCSKQKKRIVGISFNTFKYRMYGLSDMFTYGHIDDMVLYWNPDLDQRRFDEEYWAKKASSLRTHARARICEVYLSTEFLARVGRELKWSLRDSWAAFADHFCVIDKEQIDFFCPKYSRLEYPNITYREARDRYMEISFRDWLNMHMSLDHMDASDDIPD